MLSDGANGTAKANRKRTKRDIEVLGVGLHTVKRDEGGQERHGAPNERVLAYLWVAHEVEHDPIAIGLCKNR